MIPSFVIDSSIIIKWIKDSNETDRDKALVLYKKLHNKEIKITIPDLLFYELSNFGSRQPIETLTACHDLINNLFDPEIGVEILPANEELIQYATSLAHDLNISAYDATYLAVAEKYNTKLVTADKKLLTVAPNLTTSL